MFKNTNMYRCDTFWTPLIPPLGLKGSRTRVIEKRATGPSSSLLPKNLKVTKHFAKKEYRGMNACAVP
jgi:hypothetical protein